MIVTVTGGMGYLGGELVRLLLMDDSIKKIHIIDKGIYGVSHFKCALVQLNKYQTDL